MFLLLLLLPADEPANVLKNLGATVQRKNGKIVGVDLSRARLTPKDTQALGKLADLESLSLVATPIGDASIKHLTGLKKLRVLNLGGTQVGNEGLKEIGKLTGLEELTLHSTKVTAAGLKHLVGLKKLRSLDLSFTRVSSKGVEALGNLPLKELRLINIPLTGASLERMKCFKSLNSLALARNHLTDDVLRVLIQADRLHLLPLARGSKKKPAVNNAGVLVLDLSGAPITDKGLAPLAKLKGLIDLNLADTAVTDLGLASLAAIPRLQRLHLAGKRITDAGMKSVAKITTLRELLAAKTAIGDKGLLALTALKKLTLLDVRMTAVTEAGVAKFEKALPDCFVSQ